MKDLKSSQAHEIAKQLTEKAIEHGYIVKHSSAVTTADNVMKFYQSVYNELVLKIGKD